MPPRPAIKIRQGRPVSAVYIGKGPSPSIQDLSHSASSYASLIDGTPPAGLPDLPEPSSPHSSVGSVKSGLPSPPATNSTGSGSTGDPATIALRQRPLSHHSNSSASTSSDSYHGVATPIRRSSSRSSIRSNKRLTDMKIEDLGVKDVIDDDYDKENDNDNESNFDGDDTARLDRRLGANGDQPINELQKSSSENVMALQRAKSLAQRNRLALDKLSRLGSPSPARSGTPNNSRSPAPSHFSSTSSTRVSNPPRQPRPLPSVQDFTRSGSETERESTHHSTSNSTYSSQSSSSHSNMRSTSSSHHHSPSLSSTYLSTPPAPPPQRLRQTSAPASPNKARLVAVGSTAAASSSSNSLINSPTNHRRNRTSLASVSQLQLTEYSEEEDVDDSPGLKTATGTARDRTRERTLNERDLIIQSALAAAASSRRSPVTSTRRRSALPREFRSDQIEESPSPNPTGGRHSVAGRNGEGDSSSRRESWRNLNPVTPARPTSSNVGRSSTLRENRHSGGPNARWSSEDFRSSATLREKAAQAQQSPLANEEARRERRQSLRGGSAESALGMWSPGGRSLLGEGLRAAGLSRRRDDEPRGSASATGSGDMFRETDRRVDWSPQDVLDEGRRRVLTEREREKQPVRASTAMGYYQSRDGVDASADDLRSREIGREFLRNRHMSDYSSATRERDTTKEGDPSLGRRERDSLPTVRAESALGRYQTPHSPAPLHAAHLLDRRPTSSPFGSRRYSVNHQANLSSSQSQLEPTRLLLESLAMFEAQLVKLPPSLSASNSGAMSSQTELAKNAQGVVFAAERLSSMMKHGGSRAMEAQVNCEVNAAANEGGEKSLEEMWGRVAADYRESSRVSDDLTRALTSLLLGMSRVVKDFGTTTSEFGSPSVHGRQASLSEDDHLGSSGSAVVDGSGSAESGRRSVSSRHSWEPPPRDREREREEALRRLAGTGTRPESVLARASPATFQRLRDRERDVESPVNTAQSSLRISGPSAPTRRLFTPREQREQLLDARANNAVIKGGNLPTLDSQETVIPEPFQPSPTPASKSRDTAPDRQRTLTPLSIPKPLPFLPSESQSRRQTPTLTPGPSTNNERATRDREGRRSTLRGTERPSFPAITSPANPTTALTPHTVSNAPGNAVFPLSQSNSGQSSSSSRSQVTFSRPIGTPSVSTTLSDLHQQYERNRTTSASSANAEPSNSVIPDSRMPNLNARRKTLGAKVGRASLDNPAEKNGDAGTSTRNLTVHAADRSAATTILQQSAVSTRERRRTVTDIWPRE